MGTVTEIEGDLFDAPDNAVLIHACNCQGSWGKGIAEAFKARYPAAYRIYRAHCLNHKPQTSTSTSTSTTHPLEGTTLLIPPQPEDYAPSAYPPPATRSRGRGQGRGPFRGRGRGRGTPYPHPNSRHSPSPSPTTTTTTTHGKKHWIACLFTSVGYGKKKSSREAILVNTRGAIGDLMGQLREGLAYEVEAEAEGKEEGENGDRPGELYACRFNAGLFGVPWGETRGVLEEMGVRVTVVRPVGEAE